MDATKEILKAVSGDSNTDYDEEMQPVAGIPAHLADNFHNFNDLHGVFRMVIFVSAYYY